MGFFSWKTNDTNKSIANIHSLKSSFKVYMKDDKGNVWEEENYDGYGIFGGKDFYELLAEMNGFGSDRDWGIHLQFGISGIMILKTKKVYYGSSVDFFNWGEPLTHLGIDKSANDLVKLKEAVQVKMTFDDVKFPSLSEDHDHVWDGSKTNDCPDQGYFYTPVDEEDEETLYILEEMMERNDYDLILKGKELLRREFGVNINEEMNMEELKDKIQYCIDELLDKKG